MTSSSGSSRYPIEALWLWFRILIHARSHSPDNSHISFIESSLPDRLAANVFTTRLTNQPSQMLPTHNVMTCHTDIVARVQILEDDLTSIRTALIRMAIFRALTWGGPCSMTHP
jgi:hypothetical protein